MQQDSNILQVEKLSKYFGGLAAVSNCSIKIKKGDYEIEVSSSEDASNQKIQQISLRDENLLKTDQKLKQNNELQEESNKLFKMNLSKGQTGLSVAFDLPNLIFVILSSLMQDIKMYLS